MKLIYYNFVSGEFEYREPPHDDDATAMKFIPQDEDCQSMYLTLRKSMSIDDAYLSACIYALEHHGWNGNKDSVHKTC